MSLLLADLEMQARSNPASIAIRSRAASISYAQLMADVQQVAQQLHDCRVKSLGLYLDNGIDWIVMDLASIVAGIRLVPLPWFFSNEQLHHALDTGAVDAVVFADRMPAGIVGTGASLSLYRDCRLQPIPLPATKAAPVGLAGTKLSFTSGTTGKPRGVELDHRFIGQICASIGKALGGLDIETHLSILPYATLLENIAGVYVPLMLGKTLYAEPAAQFGLSAELRLDPLKLQQSFNRIRPGSLILTPQLLELMCSLAERGAIDPGCLIFVAVGGARVAASLIRRARRSGIPAYEGYGLTEFGSVAILNTPQNDRIGSVGKPLPGVAVEFAADGEICLSTLVTQIEKGEQRQKRITVETGDYGSVDRDGFIYVRGRKSNLIILSSGRNVAPEWLEAELNASPLILQSYVFAETEAALSALLVAASTDIADCDLETEIDLINLNLPAYAQIKNWHRLTHPFSRDNQMLTANGRPRRRQIKQLLPTLLATANSYKQETCGDLSNYSLPEIDQC